MKQNRGGSGGGIVLVPHIPTPIFQKLYMDYVHGMNFPYTP